MSNLVFPTLAGTDIAIKRTPVFSTLVQVAASGKELRASLQSWPRWRYEIPLNFALKPGFMGRSTNDMAAILGLFNAVKGQWDNFLYTDPYSNLAAQTSFGNPGDGTTTLFQLEDIEGFPIYDLNGSAQIYRTDWQGQQFLYPTPRTNLCPYSQDLTQSSWSADASGTGSVPVRTANYAIAPDGTTTATRVQFSRTAGTGFSRIYRLSGAVPLTVYVCSIWLKTNDGSCQSLSLGASPADRRVISVTPQWQRFSVTNASPTTVPYVEILIWGTTNTSLSADILAWGAQIESTGTQSTFYQPNNSNITQSDYCYVNVNSTRVTMSRPIVDGQDYNYYNPGARIARFNTNSKYIAVHLDFTELYTRTDTYNAIGWIFKDGVALQSFSQTIGAETVVITEVMGLDGAAHDFEIIMPYGTSVDFLGIDLEQGASLSSAAARPSTRYVAIGDSITHGYSASSTVKSWPFLLATAKNWQIINCGYGSRQCIASDGTVLGNLNPDVATYLIGYNNFAAQTPLATFKSSYISFINNFRAICPTKKLYCITPTWSANTNTLTLEMYRQQIRDALTALANPLNVLVEGLTLAPNDTTNFPNDPHPGDIGSAAIAASLTSVVAL